MTTPDGRLAELAERLRALGGEPSARELAEALWLARYVAPAAVRPDPAPAAPRPADGPLQDPGPDPCDRDAASDPPAPDEPDARTLLRADRPRPAGPEAEPPAGDTPGVVRVRVPMATALPQPLVLQRALRPLQHYRPPVRAAALDLDEQATAEHAAETRLLLPVLRATDRREARLRLLMDVSTSTGVWDTALEELRQICAGLGAFREVAVHYLSEDADGTLVAGPARHGGRVVRAAEQLRDPTGRQLTIVLSDCAGPLWRSGRMQRLLHHWGQAAPVAVVQPLPQRMWRRTHLPALPGTLRRREGLGARLEFLPADGGRPPGALPVPVLAPTRTALGTWARLLAGSTGLALPAPAAWVHADHPAAPPRAARAEPDAEALVRAFRRTASRQAVQLAVTFSAVPLLLPVMQLVQRAMQPQSGPTVLAEVLLSGLLERGAQDEWYEFRPGVRELLLRLLPPGDALLVLKHCGDYVDRHFGRRARNFPALALDRLTGNRTPPPQDDPAVPVPDAFAEVSALVLDRFAEPAPPPPPGRRVEVLHDGRDADWGAWAAHLLSAGGLQAVHRPVHGRATLVDDLEQLLARPDTRVALLIGSRPREATERGRLRALVERHPDRVVPFAVTRPAPGAWPAGTGSLVALWDTGEAEAQRRLLAAFGVELPPARPDDAVPRAVADAVPEEALRRVRESLAPDRLDAACVVIGTSAEARAELAAEYVRRHGAEYDIVWWMGDAGPEHRREGLARLGVEFGLPARGTLENRLAELSHVLGDNAVKWLLVLADWDDAAVGAHLPEGGHTLITSVRERWPRTFDVVRMERPALADASVRRVLVRVTGADGVTCTGFFVAPGVVVTSARVLGPDGTVTVTTADGGRHRARPRRSAGELAFYEVRGAPEVPGLWLSDRPDSRPEDVTLYAAPGRATRARAEGPPGSRHMRLRDAPAVHEGIGGPVLSRVDGSLVGVVTEPGRAVRVETLRELCEQGPQGADLWHSIVRHADRPDTAGQPARKRFLYASLARLEPPPDPGTVERLTDPEERLPRPPHRPRSWRDGAGHLYALASQDAVVRYAARIRDHLAARRSTKGHFMLQQWLDREVAGLPEQERLRVLGGATGCRITVEVSESRLAYDWKLRAVQGGTSLHRASGRLHGPRDTPVTLLENGLRKALELADTSRLRPVVEYRLPEPLLWTAAVEDWTPDLALRAECTVVVRGLTPYPGTRHTPRRDAVRRGPLTGLRPAGDLPRVRTLLAGAPPGAVPLLCPHTGGVSPAQVLDEARSLGYPLILWSRAERHRDCADLHDRAERELVRSAGGAELLARLRGLWIRGLSGGGRGPLEHLTVYCDLPDRAAA
ncbi:SAV_2336 N-terminal domain-related protein [Streptomyces glaucescens]|uniref:SAV_2336 N-terminal domain-related protein n=1 Tax=Streptomyces glaucescens TaxID=1907 RepID=UPI00344D3838